MYLSKEKFVKKLIRTVATYCKQRKVMVASGEMLNNEQESTHKTNQSELKQLTDFCNRWVNNLEKSCDKLTAQLLKLKVIQTNNVKGQHSIETNMFKVLKDIGVELSSYHRGSLNGKEIKKVMNNATHVFYNYSLIFKNRKRHDCC